MVVAAFASPAFCCYSYFSVDTSSSSSSSICLSTDIFSTKSVSFIRSNNLARGSPGTCVTGLSAISTKNHAEDHIGTVYSEQELPYKPSGFGVGKTYDTALEDKLLEEIERDKAAQAAALLKRKNKGGTKIQIKASEKKTNAGSDTSALGIKVFVRDLPKKKNIKRDLQSAFREVPGLLEICPSVIGNEKTRDPICTGAGFLIFDRTENAERFISSFQDIPVRFGKVEKQLSYKMKDTEKDSPPGNKRETEVHRLKIRDKGAMVNVSPTNSSVGLKPEHDLLMEDTISAKQDDILEAEISVFDNEELDSIEESSDFSEEEETSDLDDEIEIEVSCVIEGENASDLDGSVDSDHEDIILANNVSKVVDVQNMSEEDRRIEELERRLRKKLEDGDLRDTRSSSEEHVLNAQGEEIRKPRGFKLKKVRASKRSPPAKNSTASVMGSLKKKERQIMVGVLERYGKGQGNTES